MSFENNHSHKRIVISEKNGLLKNAYRIDFSLDKPQKLKDFKDAILQAEAKGYKRISVFSVGDLEISSLTRPE